MTAVAFLVKRDVSTWGGMALRNLDEKDDFHHVGFSDVSNIKILTLERKVKRSQRGFAEPVQCNLKLLSDSVRQVCVGK